MIEVGWGLGISPEIISNIFSQGGSRPFDSIFRIGGAIMKNTKCECGHNNPVGTVLCEYCGKPLEEDKQQPLLDMRYEGTARRSQTRKKTWVDRIWNFFSSVKVAIYLIVITLIVSVVGSLLPQERYIPSNRPDIFYAQEYGVWGEIFYRLGLSDMYSKWWYISLLAMIGISLVVCSLDRVIPLYKALKNQQVTKNRSFILRQRISHQQSLPEENSGEALDNLAEQLSQSRYKIRREGQSLLAEKGRVSRWGPYILHVGLIIFLLGTLPRLVPGWTLEEFVWVREGQTRPIPNTPYFIKNERAEVELYKESEIVQKREDQVPAVKEWRTEVVLLKKNEETGKLEEVKRDVTRVNHPLGYEGLIIFQQGFEVDQVSALDLVVVDKKTGEESKAFRVDLFEPSKEYKLDQGITVSLLNYFPDFKMEGKQPTTQSERPNNPAFVFEVETPKKPDGEKMWVIAGNKLDIDENRYEINLKKMHLTNESGLLVRTERGLWVILLGGIVAMIGLVMGFYWNHRRVWVRWHEGALLIGAHTNKNWFGLRRELEKAADRAEIPLSQSSEGVQL